MVDSSIIKLDIKQYPFVKLLLFYVFGIVLAAYVNGFFTDLYLIEIGVLCCLFFYLACFFFSNKKLANRLSPALLYLLFLCFGFYQGVMTDYHLRSDYFSNYPASQFVAVVADEPVEKEKTIRFPVEIKAALDSFNSTAVSGKVMVTLLIDSINNSKVTYGDILVLRNKITNIRPPFNPSQFDYQSYLANKNIWHQLLLNPNDFQVIDHDKGNPMLSFSLRFRQQLVDKFQHYIANKRSFQIASALIFGYRSSMDQEILSSFSKTGTIHILSVSGLHVTIVFVLLNFLMKWIDQFKHGRIFRFCFVLISIWCYVILTGMAAPMLRSGVMISFFIFGQWANRQQSPYNALAASAFLLLLINPKMLFDMGFQLSYLAMLGLSTFYTLFQKLYSPQNKIIKSLVNICFVSLAAQLTTLPLVLYYFGQFPNYFLLANLFIAIPATIMMYAGILLAILPWDYPAQLVGSFLNQLIEYTFQGLSWIASLPHANLTGFYIDSTQLLALTLSIIFLFLAWNYRSKIALASSMLFILSFIIFLEYNQLKYYQFDGFKFYNVNQQLAFARIKNNQVMLFSSVDSIQHTAIQFNVLPDLLKYTTIDQVKFTHLSVSERSNYNLQIDSNSLTILEGYVHGDSLENSDFILWRKNNREDLSTCLNNVSNPFILLDGSNSDSFIDETVAILKEKQIPYYILKNNYAYVWDKASKL